MIRLLLALAASILLSQCKQAPALRTDTSTDPKTIAAQSAAADARWAAREQAREPLDGPPQLSAAMQAVYDKGYSAGLRDQRAGRGRDPFRDDEGGSDRALRAIFGQGYDAGYDSK